MDYLVIVVGIIFSVFSTLILSYVSMATMVGPWIAPTLVLLGQMLISLSKRPSSQASQSVAIMQAIGAGGGIIATGIGFAFPMLYFLDESIFKSWLSSPGYFCSILCVLTIIAGGLGLWLGRLWAKPFIDEKKLPFPVSNLTNQVITSQTHTQQGKQLLHGIAGTFLICGLRDGIGRLGGVLAKTLYVFPSFFGKEIAFAIWPGLWSIGFTVGLSITLPLFVGMVCKYFVVFPLAQHALYLPFRLFDPIAPETFTIAFCSGLVLCEIVFNIPGYIKTLIGLFGKKQSSTIDLWTQKISGFFSKIQSHQLSTQHYLELSGLILLAISLLCYFRFNPIALILLLIFVAIATYSICEIGGKIGMVPFGRYSTFIVVPLLLMFSLDAVQATITCVFFNICAAASSDLLFDYKTADLAGIDRKKMYWYQWIGLIATSLCIGAILWLLFNHLGVGTEALFAQRGKAKALLLQSLNFNFKVVGLGIIFGWVLKRFKLNPTMVFGGLIMPNSVTFGLITGSLGTLLTKKPEKWQSLCAGVLAAESLWVLISILSGK